MAIIDKITGYYGFTIDIDPEHPSINKNGDVKTCIVAITFAQQLSDVDVVITNGDDDFAVKTGDGMLIPCHNPQVIYVNRDNAIVQFEMESGYPANSPLTLVYHSDTAGVTITQRTSSRPFEVNSVSGHFAYTVEGYKGNPITDKAWDGSDKYVGLVNKVVAVIPFTYSITAVKAELSNGIDDWGIRMGNGNIIPLKDPEVMSVNQNNFIALFTMHDGYSYPSNSPGILVYRSESAQIKVIPQDDDHNFYPVSNIYDVPVSMISGQTIDLNIAKVEPFNASVQNITWSVVSGNAEIVNKHFLYSSKGGDVVINGTIENGLSGDDLSNDYHQRFEIKVIQNIITKFTDPVPEIKAYVGEIDHTITVVAKSTTDKIHYQWYRNTEELYAGAVPIPGATNADYIVSPNLSKGNYYFFCEITSDGASPIKSTLCHVYVSIRCTNITIYPINHTMGWENDRQCYIVQYPSGADLPNVNWFSSNDNIASFDEDIDPNTGLLAKPGLLHSKFPEIKKEGNNLVTNDTVTITAITTDILGEQLTATIDITVDTFIPVENITGLEVNVNTNHSYNLSARVVPSNATNKDIIWSIADNNNSDVYITNGVLNVPNTVIPKDHQLGCTIMATIKNGKTPHDDYQQSFFVHIKHGFIPVTDIIINNDISKIYDRGELIKIDATVLPVGSSVTAIDWNLLTNNATLIGDTLIFEDAGDVRISATIRNGAGTDLSRVNVIKNFTFKCSGSNFIPVDGVQLSFTHTSDIEVTDENGDTVTQTSTYQNNIFDPFDKSITSSSINIPLNIFPENATNKSYRIDLISFMMKEKPDGYDNPDFEMPDNFWNEGWVIINDPTMCAISNNKIMVDGMKLRAGNLYQVALRITIAKGLSKDTDYVTEETIQVLAPNIEPFVPVEDIELILPSKLRALYPILLGMYNITPTDASVKNTKTNRIETHQVISYESLYDENGENGADCILFNGSQYQIPFISYPLELFEWNLNTQYFYPWNSGKCKIFMAFFEATVKDINNFNPYYPEKTAFTKEFELEFLPPYIPVAYITGIPIFIRTGKPYILSGEANSGSGLNAYNPSWDEETPSYSDIVYEILSSNCGATLTNGNVINTTGTGTITLKATIDQGLAEYLEWYHVAPQEAIAYTEEFTINVVEATPDFDRDIVTITLLNGDIVHGKNISDLLMLCTTDPSTASITIGDTTFTKDQVTHVDFYENIHNDLVVDCSNTPVESVNFDKDDGTIRLNQTVNNDPYSVEWSITDGTDKGTLSSSNQKEYVTLSLNHDNIELDNTLKVKYVVTPKKDDGTEDADNKVEHEISFVAIESREGAWEHNPTNVTSLKNFGRNFVNLVSINRIPDEITGPECLMNFLDGCINFNGTITIPEGVTGDRCLKYFMKNCKHFNNSINVPNGVTGVACMHGFLYGCENFNKPIVLPEGLTGDLCLKRFMYGCSSFNQDLIIPSGVKGYMCMMEFMAYCRSFNKPITLPLDVGEFSYDNELTGEVRYGRQLNLMLKEANNFHSTITVPAETGKHAEVCERSFSSSKHTSDMIRHGITFDGDGANDLISRMSNEYELIDGELPWPPYVHITNLD